MCRLNMAWHYGWFGRGVGGGVHKHAVHSHKLDCQVPLTPVLTIDNPLVAALIRSPTLVPTGTILQDLG